MLKFLHLLVADVSLLLICLCTSAGIFSPVRAAPVISYLVVPFRLGAVSDYMIHVSITLYKGLLLYALKKRKEKLKLKVLHVFFLCVRHGWTWSKSKTPLVCCQRPV